MEFRKVAKRSMALAATIGATVFAGSTYNHEESPIRMPKGAVYKGEEDRHIENWGKELFIIGPERDYGSDKPVRVWEMDTDLLERNRNKISCGDNTTEVLTVGIGGDSSEPRVDPREENIDPWPGESAFSETVSVWCDRDSDHPVEYFSVN